MPGVPEDLLDRVLSEDPRALGALARSLAGEMEIPGDGTETVLGGSAFRSSGCA
jgi:hypothetical protein